MTIRRSTTLIRLSRDGRGAVAPIIGLTLGLLMFITAMAIDLARVQLARQKVLTSLDAALLGAADITRTNPTQQERDEVEDRGRQFFRANFPDGYLGTDITDDDIDITVDPESGAVSGTVDYELDLIFGGILGGTQQTVDSTGGGVGAEVVRTVTSQLEVALVLDNSASMCIEENTGKLWGNDRVLDSDCTKYENLKAAVNQFVEDIERSIDATNDPDATAYYSYIPYTHAVRINGSDKDFNFCLDTSEDAFDNFPSITGLRSDPTDMLNDINNAEIVLEGGTNVAMGFYYGWAALRPQNVGLFTGSSAHESPGSNPAPFSAVESLDVSKIMILMTDGINEYPNRKCDPPGYDILGGDGQGFHEDGDADDRLESLCEQAKLEGIQVYTIAFDVPADHEVASRLRGCASPQSFYSAENSEALAQAFDDIANRLIDLRITK